MSCGKYQLIVRGTFGPVLRSLFADLEIEDKSAQTELMMRAADDSVVLELLAGIVRDGRELEQLRVDG